MGDRFYTEGDVLCQEDLNEEYEFMDADSSDDPELLDEHVQQRAPHERVHTQEQNYETGDFFDINNYKGIYFNEEMGDNEKNHCEITGAHFRYNDAVHKLARLLGSQPKAEDAKSIKRKTSANKQKQSIGKAGNVAKVKIMLDNDKNQSNISNDATLGSAYKPRGSNAYKHLMPDHPLDRHLKSINNKVKNVLNKKKFPSVGGKETFKPQTTRIVNNLNSSNSKSMAKPKDRIKISRLGVTKPIKYQNTRIAKPLLATNHRDSIKRRSQNKTTMNYSKESNDLKVVSIPAQTALSKHKKNVTSGGSYSTIQTKNAIARKNIGSAGSKIGQSDGVGSAGSKLISSYSKQVKRIKQKSSHTFCDLSTISSVLNKGSVASGKMTKSHMKKMSESTAYKATKPIKMFKTYDATSPKKSLITKQKPPSTASKKNPRLLSKYLSSTKQPMFGMNNKY